VPNFPSRSSKVVDFGTNRKRVCNFLLVINSNLGRDIGVGLTWEETLRRCPEGVVPACHNLLDNITVSGPPDSVNSFVAELQKEGVFTRPVNSVGVAFHSADMLLAAPSLKQKLQQVLFFYSA